MKKNIFSVSLIAMLAVAPFAGAMAETPAVPATQILATTSYVQGAYNAANAYTDEKINTLDAEVNQAASATNGQLALQVTEVDGKITGVTGSIAANTYDEYGAASDVQTAVTSGSITAAKAAADGNGKNIAQTYATKEEVAGLDAEVSQAASAANGQLALQVTEVDGKITAVTGSIAANTYDEYGAASDVQGDTTETVASVDAKVSNLQSQVATIGNIVVATGWDNNHEQDVTTTLSFPTPQSGQ